MEIAFKNTGTTNKGKQCEEFLSILKKLKFLLSSKDRQLSFYFNKNHRKFMITTYANRNLENPPSGSPTFFIDYDFGEDIYTLSSFQSELPQIMFNFDIQDTVRLINHYYETKMSNMTLKIENNITEGFVAFEIPDEVEGFVPLVIQKLEKFPYKKPYLNKSHVQCMKLFTLTDQNFEQLKQLQSIKFPCWYQIHDDGIFLKNYNKELQGNNFLLNRDFLSEYNPQQIKDKLDGNYFIQEGENFMIEQIKIGLKRHYKRMQVNLIVVRRPQSEEYIRSSYIQIESYLSVFPKSMKRVISQCQMSTSINPDGFIVQNQMPDDLRLEGMNNDLLKSEEPGLQGLRRIVINRWVPGAAEYYSNRYQFQRQNQVFSHKQEFIEETKTRKITYKLQQDD